MTSGTATSLVTNCVKTVGVMMPVLSKKMPMPLMRESWSPPHLSVSRSVADPMLAAAAAAAAAPPAASGDWSCELTELTSTAVLSSSASSLRLGSTVTSVPGLKRSSASARHWFSLPNLQSKKSAASRPLTSSVSQAPSGTLMSDELRNRPSSVENMSQGRKTKKGLMRQTMSATSVTMHVSKKPRRVAVDGRHQHGAGHEQPVEEGHVDLAVEGARRVHDLDLWAVRELHELADELERRRDDGLAGHDGREHREYEAGVQHPRRHRVVEGVREGLGLHAEEGRLARVADQQAWPAESDSAETKGAQVGKQGLDTGEGEQDAAQHPPALGLVVDEELDGKVGAEGPEHRPVVVYEVVDAKAQVEPQPEDHYRCESRRKLGGAEGLDGKEQHDDGARRSHHDRVRDVRVHDSQSLHRAQNRLCRREHAVRHHHGHRHDGDCLEEAADKGALLESTPDAVSARVKIHGLVALNAHEVLFTRVAFKSGSRAKPGKRGDEENDRPGFSGLPV
ncbi:uncharacterized protein PpBr36_10521 [Pyricularia pennisetigena]|uniref:uncharacterized protein n=1 Tax=Pyricularia pennisetigena TaxID=1578925 RepID=UPI0011515F3A|nr:uncharacterized protein PpBr36_10521 [Pyricularia pennisetigena]TLS21223.1 hypothetical protein PpBr36_10521 [Pyricularia pennisetigena]